MAQATLYNLLVQFATADFNYIYNKRKLRQNGKALFDELKKLAVPDTQASKNKARLMIENFRMNTNETMKLESTASIMRSRNTPRWEMTATLNLPDCR
jgi:hypothetical protein